MMSSQRRGCRPRSTPRPLAATLCTAVCTLAVLAAAGPAAAQSLGAATFVNGLALGGGGLDLSAGSAVERRLGHFSDLYYDPSRNEWWALSDRGPGGGTLDHATRVQRFTLDVAADGAIANFKVAQTVLFTQAGESLNGKAPQAPATNVLGRSFDPEALVVHPTSGHLLVSDEYGPSVYEFDRDGRFVRAYVTPANLLPRNAAGTPNFADDSGNSLGKRGNRGFEGLAVSPDGQHVYAMLQSPTLEEGGAAGTGRYARIVKFDAQTGTAVGQYAYRMERSNQGQGISSLVALGNERFLVLERNNRGIGVGAELATADKAVYAIDLAGATDVTGVALPASGTTLAAGVVAVTKGAKAIDLDADTLAALNNLSPEKWEGLAIGPKLADGSHLMLAGTDNDYSVTQNGAGTQFDAWFRLTDANPSASAILCPIGQTTGCTGTLTGDHMLLPGVLHAYRAELTGYLAPVPEPSSALLALAGLATVGFAAARRNRPDGG